MLNFKMDITENSDNFRCFSNNQRLVQEQQLFCEFVKDLLDIKKKNLFGGGF